MKLLRAPLNISDASAGPREAGATEPIFPSEFSKYFETAKMFFSY